MQPDVEKLPRATLPLHGRLSLIVIWLVSLHMHLVSPDLVPLAADETLPLPADRGVIVCLAFVSAGLAGIADDTVAPADSRVGAGL